MLLSWIKTILANIIIHGIILYATSQYIPSLGFHITGSEEVLISFAILGFIFWLLNAVVKKIIATVAFPLKYLTFGLFNIALNLGVIYAFSYIVNTYSTQMTVQLGDVTQTLLLSIIITFAAFILKKII